MFTYSPQDKIITQILHKWTSSKVHIRLILNTMLLPGWSTTVFMFCDSFSWVPCLSRAVNCTVFRKIHQVRYILWFSTIFCIFNQPFNSMILRSIISHCGQLRDSRTIIRWRWKWCSRWQHDAFCLEFFFILFI